MSKAVRSADWHDVDVETISGTFYRYRRFDDPKNTPEHRKEERERIKRMLVERVVWFAKPSTLNDPFDCQPVLVWSHDMKINRKHIERAWERGRERAHDVKPKDRDKVSQHVSDAMASLKSQQNRNYLYRDSLDKRTGVLCLSEDWSITQQWTYYGREHTGFCIEFDIQENHKMSAYRIHYRIERPEIDMIHFFMDDEYLKRVHYPSLLVKAAAWKHESEVRILCNRHGDIHLPEGIFQSITFGMAASDEDIQWTHAICKGAGLDIPFYRCELDDKTFALKRRPLNDTIK